MTRKEKILGLMNEPSYHPLLFKELAAVLDVPKEDEEELKALFEQLIDDGSLIITKKKRYASAEKMGLIRGKLVKNSKGFGFVTTEDEGDDIFISPDNLNGAFHGDIVLVEVVEKAKRDRQREGKVVRVLKRGTDKIVGIFENYGEYGFVIPDDGKRADFDIYIAKEDMNSAMDGHKVVARITDWGDAKRGPSGVITEILGYPNDFGVDVLSIIKQHDFKIDFDEETLREAEKINGEITELDLYGRKDFRNLNTFTIDGEDAKDLDDAVSIERLGGGKFRLGVHIADVSHYVKSGSNLDREAFDRGTSVYLVDRVIPMLPFKLSNDICSLNEGVDRLTFSVVMDIDKDGKVEKYDIVKSVIRSKARMTYKNVRLIIEEEPPELTEKYAFLVDDIKAMYELMQILRKRRNARGSIDFRIPEAKIILDKNGRAIDVKKRKVGVADNIIEEFMLITNETVAEHVYWAGVPFVYRIHEEPDREKIENFVKFIYSLGYRMKSSANLHPRELAELIEKVEGQPEERVINTLAVRSMMKAKYSEENLGHFALAAKHYCHFTSPIRRYPDLIIHRILTELIMGRMNEDRISHYAKITPIAAQQSSEREQAAEEAERETEDLKKAEFMSGKIGEQYEGIISFVTSFGFFVQLENTVEGLVRIEDLHDDYYIYDEEKYCLRGERTKKVYAIGDRVNIIVSAVDVPARKIDFILADYAEPEGEEQEVEKQKRAKVKLKAVKVVKPKVRKAEKTKKSSMRSKKEAKNGNKKHSTKQKGKA